MTIAELEHKLSTNGWRWQCWSDLWEKNGKEISFPELNLFDDNTMLPVANTKVQLYDEKHGKRIITEEELNKII